MRILFLLFIVGCASPPTDERVRFESDIKQCLKESEEAGAKSYQTKQRYLSECLKFKSIDF